MKYRKSTNEAASEVLSDPLSSVTRNTRRNLLIFSTICLIISITGINPDGLKLPLFDVKNLPDSYLVYGLLGLTGFSFINFLIHSISDFYRYKHKKDLYNLEFAFYIDHCVNTPPPDRDQNFMGEEFEHLTGYKKFYMPDFLTKALYFLKMFLDFFFPVLYAIPAIAYYLYKVA